MMTVKRLALLCIRSSPEFLGGMPNTTARVAWLNRHVPNYSSFVRNLRARRGAQAEAG
jgi:hypothetical protein